jgi:hypothetical protein
MGMLSQWWNRLTDKRPPPPPSIHRPPAAPAPRRASAEGELSLADDYAPPRSGRHGSAGFDPYGSDAGFAKPHSWERIDHD